MAERIRLAGGRNLVILRATDRDAHADRSGIIQMALAGRLAGGFGDCCDLQGGGARSFPGAAEMESSTAFPGMLPSVSCLIQNLERSDRGRQRCHVTAGRPDDLTYGGPGRRLHALAAQRDTP